MHILIDGLMMVITGADGNMQKPKHCISSAAADTNNDDLLVKKTSRRSTDGGGLLHCKQCP